MKRFLPMRPLSAPASAAGRGIIRLASGGIVAFAG
jgi:hypothetical protein